MWESGLVLFFCCLWKYFAAPPSPAAERSILYLFVFFAFSVIAFPNSLSAVPPGFVEFSSRIAPMHASSANTFVFKQLDEAALTEKDPTLTFAEWTILTILVYQQHDICKRNQDAKLKNTQNIYIHEKWLTILIYSVSNSYRYIQLAQLLVYPQHDICKRDLNMRYKL